MLGFGPCYHMIEVFQHPEHIPVWQAAIDGEQVDWDALFAGYRAAVDIPPAYFWRALSEQYPQAKVILTVRDPEQWYQSVYNTIYQMVIGSPPRDNPVIQAQHRMSSKLFAQTFGGRFEDREHAMAVFNQHNQEVQRVISAHRLLVYQVSEGWQPLCQFLERPVPPAPFPKTNSTAEFRGRIPELKARFADQANADT